jgi:UDP-N-acetylglucosamine 2-epimerase (non-hydrolysing)
MLQKNILIVIGTRPNFIKVTQFLKVAKTFTQFTIKIVHTGQHFDTKMADVFFEQFGLTPDYFLNAKGNTVIEQMSEIMVKLEQTILTNFKPDLMLVVGDVNSTFAAALVANKLSIKLAHIESGLRSFDKTMPEEHNRLLTDAITDYYFVTEKTGVENLKREGKNLANIFFVGNTMIDTLVNFEREIQQDEILLKLNLEQNNYVLMTMHRPATVDDKEELKKLLELIEWLTEKNKVVFPIHPRTLKNIELLGLLEKFTSNKNIICTEPLGYFSFQNLITNCKLIITDSGGIQEESTFLQKPCLTLRPNTERPITVEIGSNTLVPFNLDVIKELITAIDLNEYKKGEIPELWDGKATERILKIISKILE